MSEPVVQLATAADRERVTATFVAAFVADPAVRFFFPDDQTYAKEAAGFAGTLFDQRLAYGTVWVVEGGAAVSMWNPPGAGSAEPAFHLPSSTVARLDRYESAVRTIMPSERRWYLGVLATHPDAGGQRWGRAVMTAGLERARADGLPAYLETSSPVNVALYERSGWVVVGTVTVDGLQVWALRHD